MDGVVKEPLGGAHRDYDLAASLVKKALIGALDSLAGDSPEALKKERYEKFRRIAFYNENAADGEAAK